MINDLYMEFCAGFSEAVESKWMEFVIAGGFVFGGIASLVYLTTLL